MRRILPTILFLLALSACNGSVITSEPTATFVVILEPTYPVATPALPQNETAVPRATLEQAITAWAAGDTIIVDVRSQAAYETGHIEGAINIPLNEFESNPANIDLPKDQWIITYCT